MEPVTLEHREQLFDGLLDAAAGELQQLLGGPTVFHLPGSEANARSLFVSVLLHGNETSGWDAVRLLLRDLDCVLPRPLTLLCGNVAAAQENKRHLSSSEDFNRIWRPDGQTPLGREFWELRELLRKRKVFAALDIHNTNGKNPIHALCMAQAGEQGRNLTSGFAGLALLAEHRLHSCMEAFDPVCPTATLECGQPGDPEGIERARRYLHEIIRDGIPSAADNVNTRFYRLCARVVPSDGLRVAVGSSADISLPGDAEEWNMRLIPKNGFLARISGNHPYPLQALSPEGKDMTEEFFVKEGGELRAARALMPAMITREPEKIRQDCLCYLMEEA